MKSNEQFANLFFIKALFLEQYACTIFLYFLIHKFDKQIARQV
jgi:hypothetical protein